MKKLVVALLSCVSFAASAVSDYCVAGTTTDTSNNEILPFVTYKITDGKENTIIHNSTSISGRFNEQLPECGVYVIEFSYVGKINKSIEINITDDNRIVDLGNIELVDDETQLEELVVTSKRRIIKSEGGKLTYDAVEDDSNKGGNVLEMLRKVPMVTVDGNNNIRINGNSSFKIYLNGKEDPMLSENPSEVLRAMPSSSVKKIEVITEPGAKYDAEGVGGILNIITEEKSSTDGFMTTITADLSNRNAVGIIYARAKKNKMTASLNFTSGVAYKTKSSGSEYREDYSQDNIFYRYLDMIVEQDALFNMGSLSFSYEPDSINLITFSTNIRSIGGNGSIYQENQMNQSDNQSLWMFDSYSDAAISRFSLSSCINYQHSFGRNDNNIIFSYRYDYGRNKNDIIQYITAKENYPFVLSDNNNVTITPTNEHTFQIDYVNQFDRENLFETGAKIILRRNKSDARYYELIDNMPYLDENQSVNMIQHQDVYAGYASYWLTTDKISAKAGLRYEHTRMGIMLDNDDTTDFFTHLNNVVPNLSATWKFNDVSNISLSYQMRITRPNIEMMNPYVDSFNPQTTTYGNPDLSSERNNNITLTYSNFMNKVGFNMWLSYYNTDNMINSYTYVDNGIRYTTYGNIGKYTMTSLNAYMTWGISSCVRLNMNGSIAYSDYRFNEMNLKNNGWWYNLNCNIDCNLPFKLKLNMYAGYSSPYIKLQGTDSSVNYYGLSISRAFLKNDRLLVSIKANDFFTSAKTYTYKINAETFKSESRYESGNWGIGISVSYTLGGLSQDVKRTTKYIDNQDLKGIDNKSIVNN